MKLYYSPGACSLSPHIVREAGLPFTLVMASTKTHKLADGTDYYSINPKGYVPLLELDDGQRLSEGLVIVQYGPTRYPARSWLRPGARWSATGRWVADLHRHRRSAGGLQPAVRAQHARRDQPRRARVLSRAGVGEPAARRQTVPDGRQLSV